MNGNVKERFIIKDTTRKSKRTYNIYYNFHAFYSKVFPCYYASDFDTRSLLKITHLKFYCKVYNIYKNKLPRFYYNKLACIFFFIFFPLT